MANMLQTVKKIIQDYLDYVVLADTISGTIISVDPLEVKVDVNITLTQEFLQYDKPIPPGAVGQPITLQRAVGGQKFYVLDKQYWR
jgi:Protein of unknown function (DUF2577).